MFDDTVMNTNPEYFSKYETPYFGVVDEHFSVEKNLKNKDVFVLFKTLPSDFTMCLVVEKNKLDSRELTELEKVLSNTKTWEKELAELLYENDVTKEYVERWHQFNLLTAVPAYTVYILCNSRTKIQLPYINHVLRFSPDINIGELAKPTNIREENIKFMRDMQKIMEEYSKPLSLMEKIRLKLKQVTCCIYDVFNGKWSKCGKQKTCL